jgi:hypothetical protein
VTKAYAKAGVECFGPFAPGRAADDADSFPSGQRSLRSTPSGKTVGIAAAS